MRRLALLASAIALACGTPQSGDEPVSRETDRLPSAGATLGEPARLPNGDVVVSRAGDAPGESDLVLISPNGASRPLAPAPGPDDMPAALDDGRVVFVSGRTGLASVWVVDPKSGALDQLTNRKGSPFVPPPVRRIEPRGRAIRWDAGRGVNLEIDLP